MADWNPEHTPNFTSAEMACKCGQCGGKAGMDADFMLALQSLRDRVGPMKITSGYRCPIHPEEAKKSAPGSHAEGKAADFEPLRTTIRSALKHALDIDFPGIGLAKSFIHVDGGHPTATRPALWTY